MRGRQFFACLFGSPLKRGSLHILTAGQKTHRIGRFCLLRRSSVRMSEDMRAVGVDRHVVERAETVLQITQGLAKALLPLRMIEQRCEEFASIAKLLDGDAQSVLTPCIK